MFTALGYEQAEQPGYGARMAQLVRMGHDMGAMGDGMMSEEDMGRLDDATGAEASALFLEQMIMHHEGAIEMAEVEVENGENPDAVALAERIIEDQTNEIAEMQDLLAAL